MNEDFSSYSVEDLLDDNSVVYAFVTATGVVYNVYFRPNEYDRYIEHFPNLLDNYFGFGFFKLSKPAKVNIRDEKIYITIARITASFISTQHKDTVLLYHCDHEDGRQKGREKVFSNWYKTSHHSTHLTKRTVELVLPDYNGVETCYYMGYLTAKDNTILDKVEAEFESFVEHLIIDKATGSL